jgi:hypothetical protein
MRNSRWLLAVGMTAALGIGLAASQAAADYFGSLTLKPGETQKIRIGTTARNMAVCNDIFSAGAAEVTIAANDPHDLQPGVCAEDIGDRMSIQSRSKGPVTIVYRPIYDQGHGDFDDD